jgi:cytochrome c
MARSMRIAALAGAALLAGMSIAFAQSLGTAAEAKAMLEKAVVALKANEADAVAQFNKADGPFRDRDLYVFCYNMADGKFTAHPNAKLMGTDVRMLKVKDDPLGERIFKSIKPNEISTVAYNFPKPGTTEPAVPKESFVTQVGNQGCGVGYYK